MAFNIWCVDDSYSEHLWNCIQFYLFCWCLLFFCISLFIFLSKMISVFVLIFTNKWTTKSSLPSQTEKKTHTKHQLTTNAWLSIHFNKNHIFLYLFMFCCCCCVVWNVKDWKKIKFVIYSSIRQFIENHHAVRFGFIVSLYAIYMMIIIISISVFFFLLSVFDFLFNCL